MHDVKNDTLTKGPAATSLRRALSILGDPWTMLILKDAFNGTKRFSDFQRDLNIPRQTLSLRLTALTQDEMMYRRIATPGGSARDYILTPKAFDLQDAMYAIWLWHQVNPGHSDILRFDLVHRACGHVLGATYRCSSCRGTATSDRVDIRRTQPEQFETEPRPRIARRNDNSFTAATSTVSGTIAATLVGDMPCNEILYLLFQGPEHAQAIAHELGLGINVVRDRLEKLKELDLVQEEAEGRRLVYSVLPRAEGFFPLLLAIADWGDRWCNKTNPPPDIRVHDCGAILRPRYACDHCGEWIGRNAIEVRMRPTP